MSTMKSKQSGVGVLKILIIEDDAKTADFIEKGFQEAGFQTCHCANGEEGLSRAMSEPFDAAVVDIMLPKLDGFSVIEKIREVEISLPIIVLSARDSVESKIAGLEKGGDDYLAKPFSLSELIARVNALLRRANAAAPPTVLEFEDLRVDLLTRKVTRGGEKIDLPPLEYLLLEYLMRNRGHVVSRTTIMKHVWEYHFDTQTNIVESRVCRLRDKIDKPFQRKLIHTVRGFGYVLE